jgi:hypothetical protein
VKFAQHQPTYPRTEATMCRHCRHLRYQSSHAEEACPYAAAFYCSHCSDYGHQTSTCPTPPSKLYTDPHCVEQLVPTHLLLKYNIGSVTAVTKPSQPEPIKPTYLELPDDDNLIRKYLSNEGYKTFPSKAKELRKELETHCQKAGLLWKKVDVF